MTYFEHTTLIAVSMANVLSLFSSWGSGYILLILGMHLSLILANAHVYMSTETFIVTKYIILGEFLCVCVISCLSWYLSVTVSRGCV